MNSTTCDQNRFDQWILPHRANLFIQALRLTRNRTDAEDLVQEALLRAFTYRDQLSGPETMGGWLTVTLRNLYINGYRRRQRAPCFVELTEDRADHAGLMRTPRMESPEALVTRKMEYAAVQQAIRDLPRDYREVLILCDIENLSYQQIAERTGTPIGTIRSRISRGRQRLQRTLWGWRGTI